MTYFAIICYKNKFQANLEVSEVLITYVTNRGKARLMHILGQIIARTVKWYLNCSDMTYFAIICSLQKIEANLQVSEELIIYVTNRGRLG